MLESGGGEVKEMRVSYENYDTGKGITTATGGN